MFKKMFSRFIDKFQPTVDKPRNRFINAFSHYTTIKADYVYPMFIKQYYPGDTLRANIHIFARTFPFVRPIFDQLQMDVYAFECPNRVIWEHWMNMMGLRKHRDDSIDYSVPMGTHNSAVTYSSLAHHMGWPIGVTFQTGSVLPFRMYYKMINEYFRDQNLQTQLTEYEGDSGEQIDSEYTLQKACKLSDRFTRAYVDTQKGPEVLVPLGDTAPVVGTGDSLGIIGLDDVFEHEAGLYYDGSDLSASTDVLGDPIGTGASGTVSFDTNEAVGVTTDPDNSGVVADLSAATAASINDLRMAFQIQYMYEIDERYGSKEPELIYGHFGVHFPDARSQRCEYIGGATCKMGVTPVAQTSRTDTGESPQGTLSGIGVFNSHNGRIEKTFAEWSIVMVVMVVRAPLHYQEGMARMWKKSTRNEFVWPELTKLGAQPIYNHELYVAGTSADNGIFAYEDRYGDELDDMDMITGLLNSKLSSPAPLDYWHLGQEFAGTVNYNETFIQSYTPMERVLAVTDSDHMFVDFRLDKAEDRIMPLYNNPFAIHRF